jgi:hypothetical protein
VEDAKKRAVKVAPEVLAKYVGTYESHYLENPVSARLTHVTLKDGVLLGELSLAIPSGAVRGTNSSRTNRA